MAAATSSPHRAPELTAPYWKPWEPASEALEAGLRDLARYVAPEALRDVKWSTDGTGPLDTASGAEGEQARVEQLYDQLAREPVELWRDAWLPDAAVHGIRQLIRHPWLLVHSRQGTCLDFATTFAALCLDASIPPLLALTLERDRPRGHAFVMLTPGRSEHLVSSIGFEDSSGALQRSDADGVARLASWDALEDALDADSLLGVDFSRRLGEAAPPLATARARCRAHLQAARRAGDGLWLVDVAFLQRHGLTPYDPPATRAPIRRHIPGGRPRFDRYESRAPLIAELERASGTIVLQGAPGTGKSAIARELAYRTQFGAAWFLTASEPQALINSLNQAELATRTERFRVSDQLDREGFAEQARQRLLEADDDWVVVIDNADGDPAKLARWLPRPNPRGSPGVRQLVLITTTRSEWEALYDFPFRRLEAVESAEAAEHLPGPELTELAAGRPLLFDAFNRLAATAGVDAARIAAAGSGAADGVDAGAAALWAIARESLRNDPGALRAAACSAYLPPDGQPPDVLEALLPAPDADAARRRLAELGLVDIDSETAEMRMHRLVGAAVRADLRRTEPRLCDDVVQAVVTDARAHMLLDDHGDLATITHLEQQLTDLDARTPDGDRALGVAMHELARLLELHGHTSRSGTRYEKAERHVAGEARLVARGLHGRARTINQHHAKDPIQLRQGLAWAIEAERTMTEHDEVAAAASLALQGLLLQKLADFPRDDETTGDLLDGALKVLLEAHGRLERHVVRTLGRDRARLDPELARRTFNLAGIQIRLARERPADAKDHLDKASDVYGDVEKRRRSIYRRDVHPHIAACVIGRAYVDYFRALLVPATRTQRTQWLRNATKATVAALETREAQEGSLDLDEVTKCVRFLVKVAVARDL